MDGGAGCDLAGRLAIPVHWLKADARRRGIALDRRIGGNAGDPAIADRRDIAVMRACLRQASFFKRAIRQGMRV